MGSTSVVLVAIATAIITVFLGWVLVRGVRLIEHWYQAASDLVKVLSTSGQMIGQVEKVADSLGDIPKLVAGLTNVAQAQVDELTKMQRILDSISAYMMGSAPSGGEDERDAERKAEEWEAQMLMREHHLPEKEARERAKEAMIYKSMRYGQ